MSPGPGVLQFHDQDNPFPRLQGNRPHLQQACAAGVSILGRASPNWAIGVTNSLRLQAPPAPAFKNSSF